jgi:hypothetical protein
MMKMGRKKDVVPAAKNAIYSNILNRVKATNKLFKSKIYRGILD